MPVSSRALHLLLTPQVLFLAAACGSAPDTAPDLPPPPPPALPSVLVSVTTSGINIDGDGYLVTLDGLDTRAIGVNGEVGFDVNLAGDHTVMLHGLAPNCRTPVSGLLSDEGMTSTKPVVKSVTTRFEVTCWATGTIRIQTTATGANVPGLLIGFVTNHPQSIIDLPANGTYDVKFVTARLHRVTVLGCGAQAVANPTVRADEVVTVKATFECQ